METKTKSGKIAAKADIKSTSDKNINAPVADNGVDLSQFRFDGENIYFYNHSKGHFQKVSRHLELITVARLAGNTLNVKQLREAVEEIKLTPEIFWTPKVPNSNLWLVQEDGSAFNIRTKECKRSTPEDNARWNFNFKFDADAEWGQAPNFCRFVRSSVGFDLLKSGDGGEKRKLLLQMIVYMCSNLFGIKGMFVVIGNPSSGKSQLLNLLRLIVGVENCAAMTLSDCASRFRSSLLEDIHCIINDELPCAGVKNLDQLKKLICNEFLTIERKGKDVKSYKPVCKLLYAGNQLPILAEYDSGNAFAKRLKVLRFPNSIPEEDWDFEICEKMYAERDAIVSSAIKESEEFIANLRLAEDPDGAEIVASYMAENDSVRTFTENKIWCRTDKKNPNLKTYLTKLYDRYVKYCEANSLTACSVYVFRQQLAQNGFRFSKLRAEKGGAPKASVLGIEIAEVSHE